MRERNINVWLPLEYPLLGTWPTTQAGALNGNGTCDPLVGRPALNPLSHTSQGQCIGTKTAFQFNPVTMLLCIYKFTILYGAYFT